jgi:glucan endo-1,3-alpha-glucosidase
LVVICTYNDFTESYMTPAAPSRLTLKSYWYNVGPLLKDHSGYAELEKYFIQWYKTGTPPPLTRDALYYFYRTHPKDLRAPADVQNIVLYGDVRDELFVTTNLRQPADLQVTSGGVVHTVKLEAGMRHTRVPAYPGAQTFDLLRNGSLVIHKEGDPIDAAIARYNFTTTSGFGYSSAAAMAD